MKKHMFIIHLIKRPIKLNIYIEQTDNINIDKSIS